MTGSSPLVRRILVVKARTETGMASGGGRFGGRVRGAMVLVAALGCAEAGAIAFDDRPAAAPAGGAASTSAAVYTVKVPGVG